MAEDTIFVQIASYRDAELIETVNSCIVQATYPDRLVFGIFNQFDDDTRAMLDGFASDKRFRIIDMGWRQSRGVGFARHMCNELYLGEKYMLQIDAHTRFEHGWDTILIDQWQKCDDAGAILSAYPPGFEYGTDGNEKLLGYDGVATMYINGFFDGYIPVLKSHIIKDTEDSPPKQTIALSGGFQFGPGSLCEVPYVKEICFNGEEIVRSYQLYSFGYNFYAPRYIPIHHLYGNTKQRRFWSDMKESDTDLRRAHENMMATSHKLIHEILEDNIGDKYSSLFGNRHNISDYESLCGVDFKKHIIVQGDGSI